MITLQFIHGRGIGAELITWFGHGADYSHVDVVLPDGKLFGARSGWEGGAPPGVWPRDPSYCDGCPKLIVRLEVSPEVEKRFYDFLLKQKGKPYDKRGIVAFMVGRSWHDPAKWFCSELVTAALVYAGFFRFRPAAPANKIDPPDLILMLSVLTRISEESLGVSPALV